MLSLGNNTQKRASGYVLLFAGLCGLYPFLNQFSWQGSPTIHTVMELIATTFAFVVGILALRHYYKNNDYILLIIGAGFIGTAFLDGYHALVTSIFVKDLLPTKFDSLIAWSWLASRLFLSVMFFLSWFAWHKQMKIGAAGRLGDRLVYTATAILTLICFLFFVFTPLPRAYYPELMFHRPEEFLPGVFFALALIAYLRKKKWKTDNFEHWMIISLIINLVSQINYMSLSGTLFDMEFDVAHTLKKVSYIMVFIGLVSHRHESREADKKEGMSVVPIENSHSIYSITKTFTILIASLVVASISFMSVIYHYQHKRILELDKRSDLANEINITALLFHNSTKRLAHDVLYLSGTPPIQGIIRAKRSNNIDPLDGTSYQNWTDQLTTLFSLMLKTNDDYISARMITLEANGKEIVRVDKVNGKIHAIEGEQLQSKGHRDYVVETFKRARDEVYFSVINLNRERGKITEARTPVLRVAVPIYSDKDELFGMIVINKDITSLFNNLKTLTENKFQLYITNNQGQFLVHPNPQHEFEFESGKNYTIHDEFPGLLENINVNNQEAIIQTEEHIDRQLVSYKKVMFHDNAHNFIGLTAGVNYENMMASINYDTQQIIFISLLIICFTVLIGWIFSNSITAPLLFISNAIVQYAKTGNISQLPVNANGEIGILARSFNNLIYDIEEKTGKLQEANNNVKAVLETAADGIINIDADGSVLTFNPAAEVIFGYAADEIIGQNIKTLMPSPYRESHDGYLANYLKTGQANIIGSRRELVGRRKDGATFPIDLSVSEVIIDDKRTFSGIVRDITELKESEREIIRAKEEAEIANKTKSEFLATMSHEIRTPMNGILGMSQLLLDTKLSQEQRDFVSNIKSSGDSLLNIINDILDFSKIEAGKLEIEPITFDLKATIFEMAELFNVDTNNKQFELILNFPTDIEPLLIGDPGRIRQILMNLVNNAIKFTDHGHVLINLEKIASGNNEIGIRFSVQDTGHGIPTETQTKLFKAFVQADASTTRKYGGTGLGLSICKKLVELMEGEIGVESIPGKGSTFWFELTLPVSDETIRPLPEIPTDFSTTRTLVIDDNAINQKIYLEYLKSWHIKAEAVDSAQDALEALQTAQQNDTPYQLILSDMNMPEMDGVEMAKTISNDPALDTPKMILLTSASARGDSKRYQESGFSGFLTKPVDPDVLFDALVLTITRNDNTSDFITRYSIAESRNQQGDERRKSQLTSTLRALVAEDNLVNQKVARKILEKMNCTVDVAANGKEAVEMAKQFPYDLIFMDCQMPEMDGYEATAKIREYEKKPGTHTPIIALTANAIKGDMEKCLAAGMDDYLSKPIDQNKLKDVLLQWGNETNTSKLAV